MADYDAQEKAKQDQSSIDAWNSFGKPKEQLTGEELFRQLPSYKDLLANSGPNANQTAENNVGQQLTDKANSTL